jgi:hypothetical protein
MNDKPLGCSIKMNLSSSVSDVKRIVFPKPVGYWFITPLFSVEVYDKKAHKEPQAATRLGMEGCR